MPRILISYSVRNPAIVYLDVVFPTGPSFSFSGKVEEIMEGVGFHTLKGELTSSTYSSISKRLRTYLAP